MRPDQVQAGNHRGNWFAMRVLFVLVRPMIPAVVLCIVLTSLATAQPHMKNVLVLFSSFERDRKPLELIESAVRARVPGQVNFYTAFLDHQRFEDQSYRERMAETFRGEYRQTKLDVVIAAGIEALQLTTQYREKVFSGVPIVFFGLSASELKELKLVPGMTGVTASPGLRETIDL